MPWGKRVSVSRVTSVRLTRLSSSNKQATHLFNMVLNNEHQQGDLHRTHKQCHLQHNPARRHERAAKDPLPLLSLRLDPAVNLLLLLISICEVVRRVPRAEERRDKQQAT